MLGKIDALLNEKLSNVEWGKYKLDDLFDIVGTKSLDSNAITFVKCGINFVGRTFENNGIQGKIDLQDFEPNKAYTITATVIGNYKYVKYQKEPYYCSQNINRLTPKSIITNWNEKIAYFFVTNIQKFVSLYDNQQGGYKLQDIKNHVINVPIKDNKIDFDFMESLISELEEERISELEAYLQITGLDNYKLTNEEQKAIDEYEHLDWSKYQIKDIFDIRSYKKRFDANKVKITENIGHPYIVRMGNNNGCKGYIEADEQFLNEGNTISFGQDTATMSYQEKPYFTGDKIKILHSKIDGFGKLNAQFFLTAMNKSFSSYSWGASRFNVESLQKETINLPIKDNKIDISTMNLLISAISKLVIKDVVLYKNKKIELTKKIIDKNTN